MDRLRCLQIFSLVARSGSFVRAAQKLSLSKATVTKHVAWLEATMGAQLLNRTTKRVALTSAGVRVLEAAGELVDRYEAMESEIRDSIRAPRGAIRVGAPPSFGTYHLTPVITRFTNRFPEIEITVVLDDGRADLVGEALDLSIRIAPALQDASYVAQPLMKAPQVLVASPNYLRRAGAPTTPNELLRHKCLVHTIKSQSSIWSFAGDPPIEVRVLSSIRSNIGDVLKQAALLGAGISMHPYYMVSQELKAGLLEVVLPNCIPELLEISIVYPGRRNMPLRVRHLIDFLKDWASNPPDWSGPRVSASTKSVART